MASTLVLNSAGYPINVVPTTRAYKYIAQERAVILATYEDKYLRSWKTAMNAPAVVKLLYFLKPAVRKSIYESFTRKNVWLRDKGKCCYCDTTVTLKKMTFDHIVPRVLGGKQSWQNICTCCIKCNTKKAGRTPEQAGMKLLRHAFAPKLKVEKEKNIFPRIRNLKYLGHESWKSYIYFNIPLEEDK